MADDVSYLHALLTGGSMTVTGMFAFFARRFISKVDETAAKLTQHEKDDIGKYATVESLVRMHERLDASVKSAEDNFRELRSGIGEIKTILINGGRS